MIEWNDCVQIYKDGDFVDDVNITNDMFLSFQTYINKVGSSPVPTTTIWYDTVAKVCFGADQTFYANPNDFSFFAHSEDFLHKQREHGNVWGPDLLFERLGQHLEDPPPRHWSEADALACTEFVIQNSEFFDNVSGKTILMVGAGPTTVDVEWENMGLEYDQIWTCNKFYKNTKLENFKVDLASIGPTVDLEDPELLERVRRDNTACVFEGGISPFRSGEELKRFNANIPNPAMYFHLRYFSKIGTMPRLLCLATFLGAKKVYFVGIDGHPGTTGNDYSHAFEADAKDHGGRVFSLDLHRRQYVLLWEYLLEKFHGQKLGQGVDKFLDDLVSHKTEYQNLGESHPANLTTDISKDSFPLLLKQTGEKNE